MSCEICGRSNCTRSFHSLESQEQFDEMADSIKERATGVISRNIEGLKGHYHGNNYYIKLEDVLRVINDYY